MKIGIISEGHSDRAVITNILLGLTDLDINDIEALRPIYNLDETDKAHLDPLTFSSWSIVKSECEKRELIDGFLAFEGQDFVVIHIDTAEAEEYGIKRPDKKVDNYCEELRQIVVKQIDAWLNKDTGSEILHAIAIEETDAWLLTLFEQRNSIHAAKPKEKLRRILKNEKINTSIDFDNYLMISKPLSKRKEVIKGKFLTNNCSLNAFYEEIIEKVLPKFDKSNI